MTWVIAEPCIDVKDRACVEVCPVDCIYEYDPDQDSFVVPDKDKTGGSGADKKVVVKDGTSAHPRPANFSAETAKKQLFIHPEECINCAACEPVCPVEAIFEDSAVPDKWKNFTELNAKAFEK